MAIKAESIGLTEREKVIVLKEFGKVLSRENYKHFCDEIELNYLFFEQAERYIANQLVHAKVDTFESLKKIDQKLGIFRNEDALTTALRYFACDILGAEKFRSVRYIALCLKETVRAGFF